MPKKPAKKRTSKLTLIYFLIGLLLLIIPLSWNIYQGRVLSFNQVPISASTLVVNRTAVPQRIVIPKFLIDLPLSESRINNNVWEINPTGGSHLVDSARPGEGGNIIIYGHNKKKLFGKVAGIKS